MKRKSYVVTTLINDLTTTCMGLMKIEDFVGVQLLEARPWINEDFN